MLGGFRHKGLAELYRIGQSRRIGADYARKCILILELLDKATLPEHMNVIGLRFHGLQGKPHRWAVRVSANYRITFGWSGEDAIDVDFEDYH